MKHFQLYRLLAACIETAIGSEDYGPVRAAKRYVDWHPIKLEYLRGWSADSALSRKLAFDACYQLIWQNNDKFVRILTGKRRAWWLGMHEQEQKRLNSLDPDYKGMVVSDEYIEKQING